MKGKNTHCGPPAPAVLPALWGGKAGALFLRWHESCPEVSRKETMNCDKCNTLLNPDIHFLPGGSMHGHKACRCCFNEWTVVAPGHTSSPSDREERAAHWASWISGARDRIAPISPANLGPLALRPLGVSPCTCGAEKARTPHARWCDKGNA